MDNDYASILCEYCPYTEFGLQPSEYVSGNGTYIQLFKKAFNLYKDKLEREKEIEEEQERKLAALQEWDGVIE